ncbi:hypothetical protein TNCV_3968691 [Trichonephila clavipes]|nr:hypothetical protein TNCV_3968691 [Trichonephila clavipes]
MAGNVMRKLYDMYKKRRDTRLRSSEIFIGQSWVKLEDRVTRVPRSLCLLPHNDPNSHKLWHLALSVRKAFHTPLRAMTAQMTAAVSSNALVNTTT